MKNLSTIVATINVDPKRWRMAVANLVRPTKKGREAAAKLGIQFEADIPGQAKQ